MRPTKAQGKRLSTRNSACLPSLTAGGTPAPDQVLALTAPQLISPRFARSHRSSKYQDPAFERVNAHRKRSA